MARILVLAGTTEATQIATVLTGAGHHVTSSLAGVTAHPVERRGGVRRGGFGGGTGLARYLAEERIDVLLDATHPFAAVMPFNAATAAASAGVQHCRLLRHAWAPGQGDRWYDVAAIDDAPDALRTLGSRRALLAIGRQRLATFAACTGTWFLVRTIEPAAVILPGSHTVLERGPFTIEGELALLAAHRIDTIVAKNAGGAATAAKLDAARTLGLRVVMIARPPAPDVLTVGSVDAAAAWVAEVTSAG